MVSLRSVSKEDIKKIYEWRNNPRIRQKMFDTSKLNFDNHILYWNKRLADKNVFSYIIVSGSHDVGLAKLDFFDGYYEVDIFISPDSQGMGIGTKAIKLLIKLAKKKMIKKLVARVKPSNEASKKIFEKCGFKRKYIFYELEVI